jgi:hypothetical protein
MNPELSLDRPRQQVLKRLSRGRTLSGRADPPWPEAVYSPGDLDSRPWLARQRRLPLCGPMARFVGAPVPAHRLPGHDDRTPHDAAPLPDRVIAYPVVALASARFDVARSADLPAAVACLLAERLPGLDWWVPDDWDGPFLKSLIVHHSLPAPPHPVTGEPMALELFGRVVRAGGVDLDSRAGLAWRLERRNRVFQALPLRQPPPPLDVQVTVEVCAATYANLTHPGVGVPFYL